MTLPLPVIRYLAELDAALAARNAPDRDQIVTQVAEHITQALGDLPDPTDADIAAVLTELGDPLRIADEAGGSGPPTRPLDESAPDASGPRGAGPAPGPDADSAASWTTGSAPGAGHPESEPWGRTGPGHWPPPPPPKPPVLARPWIPAVAAALWVLGAAQSLGPTLLTTTSAGFVQVASGIALVAMLANIPLIASVVVVFCSSLFRAAGRLVWTLAIPVALLVELLIARGNVRSSPYPMDATIAWLLTIAAPVAAVGAMAWIAVRAYRRATPAVPTRFGRAGEASTGA